MNYNQLFSILSKPWANVNDIKVIACCGRDNATRIRNEIILEIKKSGKYLPISKSKIVPMEYVIKYLNLDIEYIALMAKKEQQLNL